MTSSLDFHVRCVRKGRKPFVTALSNCFNSGATTAIVAFLPKEQPVLATLSLLSSSSSQSRQNDSSSWYWRSKGFKVKTMLFHRSSCTTNVWTLGDNVTPCLRRRQTASRMSRDTAGSKLIASVSCP
mmetsp:Transcript_60230/g.71647  ORF Transcript_60230/g.71647 Transcript_60230/m.71647 type:complete len:127 (-) Transcript_60230:1062-1442(-)